MAGEFRIYALSPKGEGIGASKDGRVYIDRALPGYRVEAKIRRDNDGVRRGDIVDIAEASPHRVTPPCPHYAQCGGCTTQHASEAFYRDWKTGIVRDAFEGQDRGVIALGLLLLVATPIARVAFAGYAFVRRRDWLYVSVAGFVLAVLIAGLFHA